jgi:hypothetical protein
MNADRIRQAEDEVTRHKAAVAAELERLSAKARRTASSPAVLVGAGIAAVAIAYLATGRARRTRDASRGSGRWSQLLQTAQLLVAVLQIMRPVRRAERDASWASAPPSRPEVLRDGPQ